jgi:predicted small metal-binding protein
VTPVVHQFSCRDAGYDCEFFLETGDVDEAVHHVQDHAERNHDRERSRSDVEDHLSKV